MTVELSVVRVFLNIFVTLVILFALNLSIGQSLVTYFLFLAYQNSQVTIYRKYFKNKIIWEIVSVYRSSQTIDFLF